MSCALVSLRDERGNTVPTELLYPLSSGSISVTVDQAERVSQQETSIEMSTVGRCAGTGWDLAGLHV